MYTIIITMTLYFPTVKNALCDAFACTDVLYSYMHVIECVCLLFLCILQFYDYNFVVVSLFRVMFQVLKLSQSVFPYFGTRSMPS